MLPSSLTINEHGGLYTSAKPTVVSILVAACSLPYKIGACTIHSVITKSSRLRARQMRDTTGVELQGGIYDFQPQTVERREWGEFDERSVCGPTQDQTAHGIVSESIQSFTSLLV